MAHVTYHYIIREIDHQLRNIPTPVPPALQEPKDDLTILRQKLLDDCNDGEGSFVFDPGPDDPGQAGS